MNHTVVSSSFHLGPLLLFMSGRTLYGSQIRPFSVFGVRFSGCVPLQTQPPTLSGGPGTGLHEEAKPYRAAESFDATAISLIVGTGWPLTQHKFIWPLNGLVFNPLEGPAHPHDCS